MRTEDIPGERKQYLGDGIYAGFDGWQIWLCTERKEGQIERIALDPDTMRSLGTYWQYVNEQEAQKAHQAGQEPLL